MSYEPNAYGQPPPPPEKPGAPPYDFAGGDPHPAAGAPPPSAPDAGVVEGVPLYPPEYTAAGPDRFVLQGYKDVWAAVAFVVHLAVVLGFAGVNAARGALKVPDANSSIPAGKVFGCAAAATVVAALLSGVSLVLMRINPKAYIWVSNIAVAVIGAGAAVMAFVAGQVVAGIVLLLGAGLGLLVLFLYRRRIPFAAALLGAASGITTTNYGTVVVAALSIVVAFVYQLAWLAAVFPAAASIQRSVKADQSVGVLPATGLIAALVGFFWTSQVVVNVVHVTSSGVVATWFFFGADGMPPNPTSAATRRALTTSFGSICFGSLVVAILMTIEFLVDQATRHENEFVRCIAMCIVGCIRSLVEYFNLYAFTHVAIYGSGYIEAAKQTIQFVKQSGWTALINDSLVWPVLSFTTFVGALATGVALGAIAQSVVVGVVCFAVAYGIMLVLLRVVYSAIVTLLVCVAECPDVLAARNPVFAAKLEQAAAGVRGADDAAAAHV